MSYMLEIQSFILEHMASVADPALLLGEWSRVRRRLERCKYNEDKRGPGDESLSVGSRGNAPVGDLEDEVPQKLLDFCELYCNLYAVSGLKNNKLGSTQGRRSRFNIGGSISENIIIGVPFLLWAPWQILRRVCDNAIF